VAGTAARRAEQHAQRAERGGVHHSAQRERLGTTPNYTHTPQPALSITRSLHPLQPTQHHPSPPPSSSLSPTDPTQLHPWVHPPTNPRPRHPQIMPTCEDDME
jgi:hypothetical protein